MAKKDIREVEVLLSFRDKATNLFTKAKKEQIDSLKKFGIESKKTNKGYAVDLEKCTIAANKLAIAETKQKIARQQLKLSTTKAKIENEKLTVAKQKSAVASQKSATAAVKEKIEAEKLAQAQIKTALAAQKLKNSTEKAIVAQNRMRHSSKELGNVFGTLQLWMSRIRNALLLYYFAYRPFINVMKTVTSAAADQEVAEMRLYAAINATKKITTEQTKGIISYAGELQSLTGISDNETIKAAASLAQLKLNSAQIEKAIPLIADMTASLRASGKENMTMAETAKIVGTALSGRLSTLKNYGIAISEGTLKSKEFDDIMRDIKGSVGGMAELMGFTYVGAVNKTSEAWGDFTESLGKFVTSSPAFISGLNLLTEAFEDMTKAVDTFRETGKKVNDFWLKLQLSVLFAYASLRILNTTFEKTKSLFESGIDVDLTKMFWGGFTGVGAADASARANEYKQDLSDITAETALMFSKIVTGAMDAQIKTDDLFKSIKGNIVDDSIELTGFAKSMNEIATDIGEGMKSAISDGALKIIKRDFEELSDVVKNFGDVVLKSLLDQLAEFLVMKALAMDQAPSTGAAIFKGALKIGAALAGGGAGVTMAAEPLGSAALEASTGIANVMSYVPAHQGKYMMKFHQGGEVPAALLPGEGVVNRRGMKSFGVDNLNRLNRGQGAEGGGSTINYFSINAIDVQSFRDKMSENSDIIESSTEQGFKGNKSLRRTAMGVL